MTAPAPSPASVQRRLALLVRRAELERDDALALLEIAARGAELVLEDHAARDGCVCGSCAGCAGRAKLRGIVQAVRL